MLRMYIRFIVVYRANAAVYIDVYVEEIIFLFSFTKWDIEENGD
jgi:hypothetical protein